MGWGEGWGAGGGGGEEAAGGHCGCVGSRGPAFSGGRPSLVWMFRLATVDVGFSSAVR